MNQSRKEYGLIPYHIEISRKVFGYLAANYRVLPESGSVKMSVPMIGEEIVDGKREKNGPHLFNAQDDECMIYGAYLTQSAIKCRICYLQDLDSEGLIPLNQGSYFGKGHVFIAQK